MMDEATDLENKMEEFQVGLKDQVESILSHPPPRSLYSKKPSPLQPRSDLTQAMKLSTLPTRPFLSFTCHWSSLLIPQSKSDGIDPSPPSYAQRSFGRRRRRTAYSTVNLFTSSIFVVCLQQSTTISCLCFNTMDDKLSLCWDKSTPKLKAKKSWICQ